MHITEFCWGICWQLLKVREVCFTGTWRRRALPGQRDKSLLIVGNQVLKSSSSLLWRWLGAQTLPAEMYLQERFWLLCRCWHPYTSFCTDNVMTGSSLNPPECCGLQQGCVWSQQALAHPRGGRDDVTAASYCLSTRSGDEAHHCYIISLFNKTSKIFNLAVCYHVSWVQTALFYMSTCINIAIPSTSG